MERVDNKEVRSKIMSIDSQKRKELGINKSAPPGISRKRLMREKRLKFIGKQG